MNADEQRGYSKGYAAGREKASTERSAAAHRRAENRMWREIFVATLNGTLVNGGWRTGEKQWTTSSDYVRGCGRIADEVIKQHGHRS